MLRREDEGQPPAQLEMGHRDSMENLILTVKALSTVLDPLIFC